MTRTSLMTLVVVLAGCSGNGGTPVQDAGPMITRTSLTPPNGIQFDVGRFSPDGTKIALHYSTLGMGSQDFIGTIDSAGANLTFLADAGTYLASTAWGPNGTDVYFTDDEGIARVPAAGGAITRLATPFAAMDLDVSRDGTLITYTTNGSANVRQLVPADGGMGTLRAGTAARISPDGTWLAFIDDGADGKEHFFIAPLASGATATDLGLADTYLASVAWFSDGLSLAATSDDHVEIIGVDGGHRVVYDTGAATGVDVSRDGTKILYRVNGQTGLFVLTGF
ncbi:MAG: PD40 domain-containing protein [Myxococcaceae bacterium]|nr:PD40 domain-containing protein [Myxococcaceae bacterium]